MQKGVICEPTNSYCLGSCCSWGRIHVTIPGMSISCSSDLKPEFPSPGKISLINEYPCKDKRVVAPEGLFLDTCSSRWSLRRKQNPNTCTLLWSHQNARKLVALVSFQVWYCLVLLFWYHAALHEMAKESWSGQPDFEETTFFFLLAVC